MALSNQYYWQPSFARLIQFDPQPCRARGYIVTTQPPTWPPKDPSDTLDFSADFGQDLLGDPGDAVANLVVAIAPNNPGDLALASSYLNGTVAVLWLTEGFAATTYQLTLTATTNSGRIISRCAFLPVQNLSNTVAPPADVTDQTGAPLTDQYGNPITVS